MKNNNQPTIYDVAEKAGLSIATVSRVINTPEKVSEKTRQKVLKAIDELNFIPKADARDRARKEVGKIGVLTPFFTLPSYAKRLRGISAALSTAGYELTIFPVDSKESLEGYLTKLPFSNQVDGLIIVTLAVDDKSLQRIKKSNMPIILLESHINGFASIEIDNWHGGRIAAQHFIKNGHKICAYVGDTVIPEYTLSPEDIRLDGYKQTLLQNNIELKQEYIKLPAFPPRDPSNQVHELLDLPNPPTAIFAATDDLALHVLKVAQKRKIKIPQELSIIGFDDIDIAEYLELSTISQSLYESGKLAAERLISHISDPTQTIEKTFIPLKLIERGTTKKSNHQGG